MAIAKSGYVLCPPELRKRFEPLLVDPLEGPTVKRSQVSGFCSRGSLRTDRGPSGTCSPERVWIQGQTERSGRRAKCAKETKKALLTKGSTGYE